MKIALSLFTIVCLLFGLTSCSSTKHNSTASKEDNSSTVFLNEKSTNKESGSTEKDNNEKTLVAYYSATGNTENAAKTIAEHTNADLFVITPEKEYTDKDLDWTNDAARVSVEHDNPYERNVELVTSVPDNFEDYDTVFIGYPIWWGIAAWPVDNFIKENDFTGKTVIPFCTSASSDIGESGDLLAEMAGTGEWKSGMRFSESPAEDEITDWLDSLDY